MIRQKLISFKIDIDQLEKLDGLSKELGCNRNKLLNFFVSQGVANLSPYRLFELTTIYSNVVSKMF